jgi:hypothetical protein
MKPSDPVSGPPADSSGSEPELPPLGAGIDFTDPSSPLAPYFLQASHVIAAAVLAFVFWLASVRPVGHSDVWGHLTMGQGVVEEGRLDGPEWFPHFADRKAFYANTQWLSEAAMYLVYRGGQWLAGGDALRQAAGGMAFLRFLFALLIVARFGVLWAALRRFSGSPALACAGILLYLVLVLVQPWTQGPQMVGELCFACLLLALSRPVLSNRTLVLVPLILVLWANCHRSFLVGLALLACTLAGRAIEAGTSDGSWNLRRAWADPQLRRLLLGLVLAAVALAVLNPLGVFLYPETLRMATHPNLATLAEWRPMPFALAPGGHWVYLGTLLLLAVSQALSPRSLSAAQVILLVGFGVAPCLLLRMTVWWLMLVPWLALPLWAAIGEQLPWGWLHTCSVPSFRKTVMAGVLVIVSVLFSMPVQWLRAGGPPPLTGVASPETPWRVAAQLQWPERKWLPALGKGLQQHYPGGRFTGYIFASETQGDYLAWALGPDVPVMASRFVQRFQPDYWQDVQTVLQGGSRWLEILHRYHANLVVVEVANHLELAQGIRRHAGWQVVLDVPESPVIVALRKRPLVPSGQRGARAARAHSSSRCRCPKAVSCLTPR